MAEPFYIAGLRFECARCSACCRYDPGYVFLSDADARALAVRLSMVYSEFILVYCRWVPAADGGEWLSLKERANFDCIFWAESGCSVYEARPEQCRAFPFWESTLAGPDAWEAASAGCPGMNRGKVYDAADIAAALARQRSAPFVSRHRR